MFATIEEKKAEALQIVAQALAVAGIDGKPTVCGVTRRRAKGGPLASVLVSVGQLQPLQRLALRAALDGLGSSAALVMVGPSYAPELRKQAVQVFRAELDYRLAVAQREKVAERKQQKLFDNRG